MASVAGSGVVAPAAPAAPAVHPDHLVIGVDTHEDTHTAAAMTGLGLVVDRLVFDTCEQGLAAARAWVASLGRPVAAWGIEGTGSWGAGLARQLTVAGERVVEVNRGDRHTRRMLGGKSDPLDAEAAARAVLSGFATAIPKSGDGPVEQIRVVGPRAARRSRHAPRR